MSDINDIDPNDLSMLNRLHIHDELIKSLIPYLPDEGKRHLSEKLSELQKLPPLPTETEGSQEKYINSFLPK